MAVSDSNPCRKLDCISCQHEDGLKEFRSVHTLRGRIGIGYSEISVQRTRSQDETLTEFDSPYP
jgi:hypothetical protein